MKLGVSVTHRVAEVKQPRGGYLPLKTFERVQYDDGIELAEAENVGAGTVGTVIDCLTRIRFGAKPKVAFGAALAGARGLEKRGVVGAVITCSWLVARTADVDTDEAIVAACKVAGSFDAFYRSGYYKPHDEIEPDADTIANICIMLARSESFIQNRFGPVLLSGFMFEGAYNDVVSYGDGDFLLAGGMFDFKTMKSDPKTKHTLQLLMYYLMGLASKHPEFRSVGRIGFYNPRLNKAYLKRVAEIPTDVLEEVSTHVLGYNAVPKGAGEEPDMETSVGAALGLE